MGFMVLIWMWTNIPHLLSLVIILLLWMQTLFNQLCSCIIITELLLQDNTFSNHFHPAKLCNNTGQNYTIILGSLFSFCHKRQHFESCLRQKHLIVHWVVVRVVSFQITILIWSFESGVSASHYQMQQVGRKCASQQSSPLTCVNSSSDEIVLIIAFRNHDCTIWTMLPNTDFFFSFFNCASI